MLNAVKYWLWLTSQLSPAKAWAAYRHFNSPELVYHSDQEEYKLVTGLEPRDLPLLADKSLSVAEQILDRCDRAGIRILTYSDSDYPERLRSIPTPPLVLYLRGRLLRFDDRAIIAFAGTRRATPYGLQSSDRFAQAVTRAGGIVATGNVGGCDRASLKGALKAGGPVLCVVAGGVDLPYYDTPEERQFLDQVASRGCLLSECPPGTPHKGALFRRRNSILCGLSLGLLCTEAGERSGTLQVAALAAELGRDIYAIPANLTARRSSGTNGLLSRGLAQPVTSAADILSRYRFLLPQDAPAPDVSRWAEFSAQAAPEAEMPEPAQGAKLLPQKAPAAQAPAAGQAGPPPQDRKPLPLPEKPAPRKEYQSGADLPDLLLSPPAKKEKQTEAGRVPVRPGTEAGAPREAEKRVDTGPNKSYIELLTASHSFSEAEKTMILALAQAPATVEGLAAQTGLPSSSIAVFLSLMVIGGQVEELTGGRFRLIPDTLY